MCSRLQGPRDPEPFFRSLVAPASHVTGGHTTPFASPPERIFRWARREAAGVWYMQLQQRPSIEEATSPSSSPASQLPDVAPGADSGAPQGQVEGQLERHGLYRIGLAYGRLIYRLRWLILALWLIGLAASIPFAS